MAKGNSKRSDYEVYIGSARFPEPRAASGMVAMLRSNLTDGYHLCCAWTATLSEGVAEAMAADIGIKKADEYATGMRDRKDVTVYTKRRLLKEIHQDRLENDIYAHPWWMHALQGLFYLKVRVETLPAIARNPTGEICRDLADEIAREQEGFTKEEPEWYIHGSMDFPVRREEMEDPQAFKDMVMGVIRHKMTESPMEKLPGYEKELRPGKFDALSQRVGEEFMNLMGTREELRALEEIQAERRRMADSPEGNSTLLCSLEDHHGIDSIAGIHQLHQGAREWLQEPHWGITREVRNPIPMTEEFIQDVETQGLDLEEERIKLMRAWETEAAPKWVKGYMQEERRDGHKTSWLAEPGKQKVRRS